MDIVSRIASLSEPGSVIERVARNIAHSSAIDGDKEAATADDDTDAG